MLLYDSLVTDNGICPGSLTENISSIVTGAAQPHGKVTYILAGISMFFLLLTACWATFIIRCSMPCILLSSFSAQAPAGNSLSHCH